MQTAPVSTQLFLSESMDEGITKMLDRLDRVDMQIVDGTHEVDGEGSINGASWRSVNLFFFVVTHLDYSWEQLGKDDKLASRALRVCIEAMLYFML